MSSSHLQDRLIPPPATAAAAAAGAERGRLSAPGARAGGGSGVVHESARLATSAVSATAPSTQKGGVDASAPDEGVVGVEGGDSAAADSKMMAAGRTTLAVGEDGSRVLVEVPKSLGQIYEVGEVLHARQRLSVRVRDTQRQS